MGWSLKHAFKGVGHAVKAGWNVNKAVLNPSSLLGGGGGDDREAKIDSLYAQGRNASALNSARAIATQQRSLGATKQGFAGARTALGAGRTQALQGASDNAARSGANAAQSLTDRGLANTTILDNAQQGITANLTRESAVVEAAYADMLARYNIGEAAATTSIRGGIADSYENLGRTQAGLYSQQAGTIASLPSEDPNAWLDSLLGIGGTALGYAIGGPGGGAAASAFGTTSMPAWWNPQGQSIPPTI